MLLQGPSVTFLGSHGFSMFHAASKRCCGPLYYECLVGACRPAGHTLVKVGSEAKKPSCWWMTYRTLQAGKSGCIQTSGVASLKWGQGIANSTALASILHRSGESEEWKSNQ